MSHSLRRLVVLFSMLALLLAGCGGGGSTTSTDGTSPYAGGTATPVTASGLSVTIMAKMSGLAKTAGASSGYQWRVHVRATATGDDLAPAVTVPAPTTDGGKVTVSLGRVASQAAFIVVEVLAPGGALVSTQTAPFTWTPAVHTTGQMVAMTVTMPLVSLVDSLVRGLPPAVNVPAKGTVQLRAVGGTAPYQFLFENNGTGSQVGLSNGLLTAGTRSGTDYLTVRDSGGDESFVIVNVAPAISLSPAGASVAAGARLQFKASGGQGDVYAWQLVSNRSGGSIDAATGAYVAGPNPNAVDVVEARDAAGHRAAALVSVGSPITITPSASGGAVPGETLRLTVSGGTGPYVWHYASNASGGALDPQTGVYTAGTKDGVADVVAVSDVAGAMQVFEVPIAAPLAVHSDRGLFVPPTELIHVSPVGGFPPYSWTFVPSADSMFLDGFSPPVYNAGFPVGAVDLLTLTDSHGNSTTARITVAPELLITPTNLDVRQGDAVQYSVTGGTGGPYTWAVHTDIGSTIDPSTGAYRAGHGGELQIATDAIDVWDRNGFLQVLRQTVMPSL